MIGYFVGGLLILSIGIRDAYMYHYKKTPLISPEYPTMQRYLFPVVWIVFGIIFIWSGFHV